MPSVRASARASSHGTRGASGSKGSISSGTPEGLVRLDSRRPASSTRPALLEIFSTMSHRAPGRGRARSQRDQASSSGRPDELGQRGLRTSRQREDLSRARAPSTSARSGLRARGASMTIRGAPDSGEGPRTPPRRERAAASRSHAQTENRPSFDGVSRSRRARGAATPPRAGRSSGPEPACRGRRRRSSESLRTRLRRRQADVQAAQRGPPRSSPSGQLGLGGAPVARRDSGEAGSAPATRSSRGRASIGVSGGSGVRRIEGVRSGGGLNLRPLAP